MKRIAQQSFTALVLLSLVLGLGFLSKQTAQAADTVVVVPGTHQSELGCSGDWQPECLNTELKYDAADDLYSGTFLIQPDNDQDKKGPRYKIALNKSWTENYGANGQKDGPDIKLVVTEPTEVLFVYDNNTHWIADSVNFTIAGVIGDFQKALGCNADNDPACLRAWLQDVDGDGIYVFSTNKIPAGKYQAQVAVNKSADQVYGANGAKDGAAISFEVKKNGDAVTFSFEPKSKALSVGAGVSTPKVVIPQPGFVTLPGTHQSELGCPADWIVDCETTALIYDEEDEVWQATFRIEPGNDQDKKGPRYKVALEKSWDVNYGLNAAKGGADIPLVVAAPTDVKFYYDHATHWATDNVNSTIAVMVGDFQQALGCNNNNDPGCLRSWLKDPEGDGTYVFTTTAIPAGQYEARAALNESLDKTSSSITFTVPADGHEMFFSYNATSNTLQASSEGAPKGDLSKAQAVWVLRDTIAWQVKQPKDGETFALYYAANGGLNLSPTGVTGGDFIQLTYERATQGDVVLAKYPHLRNYAVLKLNRADLAKVPDILKGQIALVELNKAGKIIDATSLQIPGVLDDLYYNNAPLGVNYQGDVPTLSLWAPTAKSVTLHLFEDATANTDQTQPMSRDSVTGVWSITGSAGWTNKYYLYEVEVYVPSTGKVEKNLVTDPYSISLSTNSKRSQIVNFADSVLAPQGWDSVAKSALAAPEDSVIHELHIRDFSVNDTTVPADLRGTYLAFTVADSNGMKHLKSLADAGLTHIHLLPAFDIASVNEDKSTWASADPNELAQLPGDSDQQSLLLAPFKDQDGFNWGYDPLHYNAPEGSYATDPNGSARVREFRQMVQALNQTGLRVVMDVVYNHTNASGQNANSVLDKVVPGYYHRLNADGRVEKSTCCDNTATENLMMEKLMIDSVVMWAKYYKVDGFRFDLMGHHMVSNMVAVRNALDALTLEKDGVDGSKILLYGEGWDFGEVAKGARGKNATQINLAGTGIATFNDRIRDSIRGGSPFTNVRDQGFITGLFYDPNEDSDASNPNKYKLLGITDWVRLGLAGNLKDYELVDSRGKLTPGNMIVYNGGPAGYALDPQEHIAYASAHDNETLFDAIQYKLPFSTTPDQRVRVNNLGIDLVMFSQGIPFFHAGDDLLRSKSLDGNTYNSGDWYNKLDLTYQSNNWAVGLPDFGRERWDLMKTMFTNPNLKMSAAEIQFAHAHFLEALQIRKSSPLFRLQTGELVKQHVTFLDTGESRTPGVIIMGLDDRVGGDIDSNYELIVVAFNALPTPTTFTSDALKDLDLQLHPIQANSVDDVVKSAAFDSATGTITLPGRTTVVYVLNQTTPEPTITPIVIATSTPAPVINPTEVPATPESSPEPAETGLPLTGILLGVGAALIAVIGGIAYWFRPREQ
jgi:pullulanase-type alpha-1,6-glucosidase